MIRDKRVMPLPLFPLNVVLFPKMVLPLRIFEERYKQMIAECLKTNSPFGVALIKSGEEVGGPAEPHRVGTLAKIMESRTVNAQGEMELVVRGVRRFRILSITQQEPFLRAEVGLKSEVLGDPAVVQRLVSEAEQGLRKLVQAYMDLTQEPMPDNKLPVPPRDLSYWFAQFLPLSQDHRQDLLEMHSTAQRLEKEVTFLRLEHLRMEKMIFQKKARLN